MTKTPEWGYRADGQPRKFGDLTPEEKRAVTHECMQKLMAELNDPSHATHRAAKAILHGPDLLRTAN